VCSSDETVATAMVSLSSEAGHPSDATVIVGASAPAVEEEAGVPAPTGCLPFSFTLRLPGLRRYRHVKLPQETVHRYIEMAGDRCFAYCNLHNALYHYELPGVGLVGYAWVWTVTG
jgi:hypothetical protein